MGLPQGSLKDGTFSLLLLAMILPSKQYQESGEIFVEGENEARRKKAEKEGSKEGRKESIYIFLSGNLLGRLSDSSFHEK